MLGDIPICYINKEIELKTPCVSIKQKITKHFTGTHGSLNWMKTFLNFILEYFFKKISHLKNITFHKKQLHIRYGTSWSPNKLTPALSTKSSYIFKAKLKIFFSLDSDGRYNYSNMLSNIEYELIKKSPKKNRTFQPIWPPCRHTTNFITF